MKARISFLGQVCSAIGLAIAVVGTAFPAAAGSPALREPTVYEDRNNNGTFDAGDVDLSGFPAEQNIETTESVVVNRLSIGQEPYIVKRITAGRRITLRGTVAMTAKLGELRLTAPELQIANNTSISAISHIDAEISGPIIIGNNVKMQSLGKSPSKGFGSILLSGHTIQAGSNFYIAVFDSLHAEATRGALTIGPLANLRSIGGPLFFEAQSRISIQGARSISGKAGVDFWLPNRSTGVTDVTGSRLSASADGQVSFYHGDVNFTPALIPSAYCLYYTADDPDGVVCVEP